MKLLSITIPILLLFSNASLSQPGGGGRARIESEYKLAVLPERVDALWAYLEEDFREEAKLLLDSTYTVQSSEELFIDQYFDTEDAILYEKEAGLRYRQRYKGDSLMKRLVQLKLPGLDSTGVARKEIKFDWYEKVKKSDRQAMHSFWRVIRPGDREEVDFHLANFGITGSELKPVVKMKQLRRRIYMQQNGEPILTITLDKASSYYFPYSTFYEMELELNEIRYTQSTEVERQRMEALNTGIKRQLLTRFPSLVQDQTPKYNKMRGLVSNSALAFLYDKFAYFILGGMVLYASFLYAKTNRLF